MYAAYTTVSLQVHYTTQKDSLPDLTSGIRQARGGMIGKNGVIGFAADGMVRSGAQLVTVAEEGTPEMIIPLGSQRRQRDLDLWEKAGRMLGVPGFANGGIVGEQKTLPEWAAWKPTLVSSRKSETTQSVITAAPQNQNTAHPEYQEHIPKLSRDDSADANKPVSTAMQNALNGKANTSHGTHVSYSSTAPKMNGTATVGSASTVSRSDHIHPTDTSRAAISHTHTKSQITDFPSGLPASDVYAWAKAAQKPGYTWNEISNKPDVFSPASHSHEYLPLSGGTLTGDLCIRGARNFGTKINFGDGDYVHISEPSDDNLEIKAKNINFVVSGNITKNGTALAGGTGTDYATYRVRDIALLAYTPSSLGNGQIALVYT